jgi:serine/threonine-protein kinase
VVYRARHLRLGRLVALKMALAGSSAGPHERERSRREAEAVAALRHPNVVQVYDVGDADGRPYFTMELMEGGSLARKLSGAPQPARQTAALLATLAGAVQAAHEAGVVHRDLKPANVLLTETGVAKIADFGLAKLLDIEQGQTQTGAVLGSPSYMAPEQAEGKVRAIGPATDVYALGAILYELLTGRPPFVGASFLETLDQVRAHDPAPPQTLQPKVPEDLAAICLKCLEKNPAQRYPSAAALVRDLDLFLRGEALTARKMTLWDQAARLVRHSQLDLNWGAWATLILWFAPLPFLAAPNKMLQPTGRAVPGFKHVAVCPASPAARSHHSAMAFSCSSRGVRPSPIVGLAIPNFVRFRRTPSTLRPVHRATS